MTTEVCVNLVAEMGRHQTEIQTKFVSSATLRVPSVLT